MTIVCQLQFHSVTEGSLQIHPHIWSADCSFHFTPLPNKWDTLWRGTETPSLRNQDQYIYIFLPLDISIGPKTSISVRYNTETVLWRAPTVKGFMQMSAAAPLWFSKERKKKKKDEFLNISNPEPLISTYHCSLAAASPEEWVLSSSSTACPWSAGTWCHL